MNTKTMIGLGLLGGAMAGAYWFWQRRNWKGQLSVGSPVNPRLEGTSLKVDFVVTNISDTPAKFKGLLGQIVSKGANIASFDNKEVITIAARAETRITVTANVNVVTLGVTLYQLIQNGGWREAGLTIRGNAYAEGFAFPFDYKIL